MKRLKKALLFFTVFLCFPFTMASAADNAQFIATNQKITNNLENESAIHNYQFILPEPGSLQIQLEFPIEGKYKVTLIESNNGELRDYLTTDFGTDKKTESGFITHYSNKVRVAAGSYYIKVQALVHYGNFYNTTYYSNKDYSLTALYTAEPTGDYEKQPNGTIQTATPLKPNTPITGNFDTASDVDYYKVSLAQPGSLQLQLEYPIEGKTKVTLIASENDILRDYLTAEFGTGKQTESGYITEYGNKVRLAAGDYYIKIETLVHYGNFYNTTYFSNKDYVITALYTAELTNDYEKQPNGTVQTATPIHLNVPITGNTETSGDVDYYKISLAQPSSLQIKLEHPTEGGYKVKLIKSDNGVLNDHSTTDFHAGKQTDSGYTVEYGNKVRLPAGDYYIRIETLIHYGNFYNTTYFSNKDYKLTAVSDFQIKATPNRSHVLVNGSAVNFESYTILDNNYFKLRDLAYVLRSTDKQFDVDWDAELKSILIEPAQSYTVSGGEMAVSNTAGAITVLPSNDVVIINGNTHHLQAYKINGNNYFKLRDVAQAIDFAVLWNSQTSTIEIDTNDGYTE